MRSTLLALIVLAVAVIGGLALNLQSQPFVIGPPRSVPVTTVGGALHAYNVTGLSLNAADANATNRAILQALATSATGTGAQLVLPAGTIYIDKTITIGSGQAWTSAARPTVETDANHAASDYWVRYLGGTRIICQAGPVFAPSPYRDPNSAFVSNFHVSNLIADASWGLYDDPNHSISDSDSNNMPNTLGLAWSSFRDCYVLNASRVGLRLTNFAHVELDNVIGVMCEKGVIGENWHAGLQGGNSLWDRVYMHTRIPVSNNLARYVGAGLLLQARSAPAYTNKSGLTLPSTSNMPGLGVLYVTRFQSNGQTQDPNYGSNMAVLGDANAHVSHSDFVGLDLENNFKYNLEVYQAQTCRFEFQSVCTPPTGMTANVSVKGSLYTSLYNLDPTATVYTDGNAQPVLYGYLGGRASSPTSYTPKGAYVWGPTGAQVVSNGYYPHDLTSLSTGFAASIGTEEFTYSVKSATGGTSGGATNLTAALTPIVYTSTMQDANLTQTITLGAAGESAANMAGKTWTIVKPYAGGTVTVAHKDANFTVNGAASISLTDALTEYRVTAMADGNMIAK